MGIHGRCPQQVESSFFRVIGLVRERRERGFRNALRFHRMYVGVPRLIAEAMDRNTVMPVSNTHCGRPDRIRSAENRHLQPFLFCRIVEVISGTIVLAVAG